MTPDSRVLVVTILHSPSLDLREMKPQMRIDIHQRCSRDRATGGSAAESVIRRFFAVGLQAYTTRPQSLAQLSVSAQHDFAQCRVDHATTTHSTMGDDGILDVHRAHDGTRCLGSDIA